MTPFLLIATGILLLWVLVAGERTGDASRWISLFGFTFQPSEIAKGTMVLATAQILSAMQRPDGSGADKKAFKYILWIVVPVALLIMVENLSTAVLLCFVIFLMMFIGRVPLLQLGKLAGFVVGLAIFAFIMVMTIGNSEEEQMANGKAQTEQVQTPKKKNKLEKILHRADTWKSRIKKFSNKKEIAPEDYDLDKDAQVAHANIAIVSSNIIGKGPGKSVERDFLSQAFSDFIYAIIIEELGFFGATFVIFLYIVLLFRTARIASQCENNFPAFLAMGLALLLVVQATFNMLVAVGIAPVTGQPLPLISKGGTSTIINCAYLGMILSVSRSAKKSKSKDDAESE
jgi:cell division protein FtsW